ncbi:MAG: restriction endonuclease subunit S [Elusimicrobiota bacterium]|jgi:hypothetical protein|nr:restriction endonuclease subunit S [Elusimicrobiota bacterium]
MKIKKLQDICADIFSGATIFTNDNLSRKYYSGGYRVIRLADIQNNEISFEDCLFYNKQDYKKNRYLLQDNDILLSSRGTIFKVAIYYKKDCYKTIPSGFLTCIRLNPDLHMSVNYVVAYLRHKEKDIINAKNTSQTNDRKPKIQLNLSDILDIEIPIIPDKIKKDIDRLSLEASDLLKNSIQKTKEVEKLILDI